MDESDGEEVKIDETDAEKPKSDDPQDDSLGDTHSENAAVDDGVNSSKAEEPLSTAGGSTSGGESQAEKAKKVDNDKSNDTSSSEDEDTKTNAGDADPSNLEFTVEETNDEESFVIIAKERIDELRLHSGDTVLLKSEKEHQAVSFISYKESVPKKTILINKRTCNNLAVQTGCKVTIKPCELKEAKSVKLVPICEASEKIDGDLKKDYLYPLFEISCLPVHEQTTFMVHNDRGKVEFLVLKTNPSPCCIVTSDTNITANDKPKTREEYQQWLEKGGSKTEADQPRNSLDDLLKLASLARPDDARNEEASSVEEKQTIRYKDIGGYKEQIQQIKDVADLPLRRPEFFKVLGVKTFNGILLTGPPGTGKSMIAQAVANETGANFVMISGPATSRRYVGETEELLRNAFEEATKKIPAVIFIDQLDAIVPKKGENSNSGTHTTVSQLAALMDTARRRNRLVVIAATNRPEMLDPEVRGCGRFETEIKFGVPSATDRLEILNICAASMKLADDLDLQKIANDAHGFVGADISSLCSKAALKQIREKANFLASDEEVSNEMLESLRVTQENFQTALKEMAPSSLREHVTEIPQVTWDDVGGLEDVKKELEELIIYPMQHPEIFAKFGMPSPRGVLFYGPPGCGKTLLAKTMANQCQVNFISIKGPEIFNLYVGESEANIRRIFDKARLAAPCILFFDELDSIGRTRSNGKTEDGGSHVADRVINQLLVEIDGVESNNGVFVVGATNRPDLIESALLRPGRLDQLIYIPLPDEKSRVAILKATLRKSPHTEDVKMKMLNELGKATEGFSGADLSGLCQRACKLAIGQAVQAKLQRQRQHAASPDKPIEMKDPVPEIRRDHFDEAMKLARKSVTAADVNKFQQFARANGFKVPPNTIRPQQNTAVQSGGGSGPYNKPPTGVQNGQMVQHGSRINPMEDSFDTTISLPSTGNGSGGPTTYTNPGKGSIVGGSSRIIPGSSMGVLSKGTPSVPFRPTGPINAARNPAVGVGSISGGTKDAVKKSPSNYDYDDDDDDEVMQ